MIDRVCIVIPAHDEAERIGACLRHLRRATAHPRLRGLAVEIAVVLDACTDATEDVARAVLAGVQGASLVRCDLRSAGAARAAGASAVLAGHGDLGCTWLATTDADTRVPDGWLAAQLALADGGADAVVGTVEVDGWDAWPTAVRGLYEARYRAGGMGQGHGHVHGANLGVRADALVRAGGMPELALGEDRALVDQLVAAGAQVVRTGAVSVRTSARRDPRAAGGFGQLLHDLAAAEP